MSTDWKPGGHRKWPWSPRWSQVWEMAGPRGMLRYVAREDKAVGRTPWERMLLFVGGGHQEQPSSPPCQEKTQMQSLEEILWDPKKTTVWTRRKKANETPMGNHNTSKVGNKNSIQRSYRSQFFSSEGLALNKLRVLHLNDWLVFQSAWPWLLGVNCSLLTQSTLPPQQKQQQYIFSEPGRQWPGRSYGLKSPLGIFSRGHLCHPTKSSCSSSVTSCNYKTSCLAGQTLERIQMTLRTLLSGGKEIHSSLSHRHTDINFDFNSILKNSKIL